MYIPGEPEKFGNVFGWDEVNNHVNNTRPSFDGMRLVYDKNPLPPTEFKYVSRWLRKGATLVINNVDQIDPVMGTFNQLLGKDLNTTINTNCYASHPYRQGFDTHFDRHDVFILQTEGEKSWAVFPPTRKYPLHHQATTKDDPPTDDPYIEQMLSPGDVLYIPRGHWHSAVAVTPSVHLTVGPQSRSECEFLSWLATQVMESEDEFRRDFPIADSSLFGGSRDSSELLEALEAFRNRVIGVLSDERLAETFIRFVMTMNPIKRVHTLQRDWVLKDKLKPETQFRIVSAQKLIIRYDTETQYAKLFIRGHVVNLEGIPERLLTDLFNDQGAVVSGGLLTRNCPEVDWEKISEVLIELHHLGLIELVEEGD